MHFIAVVVDADTLSYTLTLTQIEAGQVAVDHGDDFLSATRLAVGDSIEGVVDREDDIDYFSFLAEEGETYFIGLTPGMNTDVGGLPFTTLTSSRSTPAQPPYFGLHRALASSSFLLRGVRNQALTPSLSPRTPSSTGARMNTFELAYVLTTASSRHSTTHLVHACGARDAVGGVTFRESNHDSAHQDA